MKEHEAYALARKQAQESGMNRFVVTNAATPGYDYDVVAIPMGKTVQVEGVVTPEGTLLDHRLGEEADG